jgi:hypothetical protein
VPAGDGDGFLRPDLNLVQGTAVDALREDGIAVLRFQDLLGAGLWRDARMDIQPFVREAEDVVHEFAEAPADKDELIIRRFETKTADGKSARPRLSINGPWLRIAASEALLDVVNSYRNGLTRLCYVDNWFTVPYPAARERIASQCWHRDPEDEHIVKVFVYLSDVDEEAGPFEYIRGSAAGGRYGHLWPWGEGNRYPPSNELEAAVELDDRSTVIGPAGTVIICDTGGFHRGGFVRHKPRILAISTYLRRDAKEGRRRFTVDFEGQENALPPEVRAALG